MSVFIEKSGLFTTVQDLGRTGFRRFGINPNGAMDRTAARLINVLLGNDEAEAILEMHFPAPRIRFESAAVLALGGGDFSARLNERPLGNWRPITVRPGDVLEFTGRISGNRAYLAVKGGFEIARWLGSASTNVTAQLGGYEGRPLRAGDRLVFRKSPSAPAGPENYSISNSLIPRYSRFPTVRFVEGGEYELLTGLSQETFLKGDFIVAPDSDRMGFRLAGPPLYLSHEKEMVSSAVDFGTLQLLPGGQLIVLMADHQTTGGYPRIGHVIPTDTPLLAQLGPGDKVAFYPVSIADAESLMSDFARDLNLLRLACRFRH
jgi:antagonist of KipI